MKSLVVCSFFLLQTVAVIMSFFVSSWAQTWKSSSIHMSQYFVITFLFLSYSAMNIEVENECFKKFQKDFA